MWYIRLRTCSRPGCEGRYEWITERVNTVKSAAPNFAPVVRKANENLEGVVTLPEFLRTLDASPQLTLSDQRTIVKQARLMFQEVYVNLQLKRAMHAVDPVQRLRLLERRLSVLQNRLPERKFHQEMISHI